MRSSRSDSDHRSAGDWEVAPSLKAAAGAAAFPHQEARWAMLSAMLCLLRPPGKPVGGSRRALHFSLSSMLLKICRPIREGRFCHARAASCHCFAVRFMKGVSLQLQQHAVVGLQADACAQYILQHGPLLAESIDDGCALWDHWCLHNQRCLITPCPNSHVRILQVGSQCDLLSPASISRPG